MDIVTMLYYGLICALLAAVGSRLKRFEVRLIIGFVVGMVSAVVLPLLKLALSA